MLSVVKQQDAEANAIKALRAAHIGRLLLDAQRNYSLTALAKLRERGHVGLTLAHTNLLAHLDVDGARITVLAERAGVTKQAVGNLVADLEAHGYVSKEIDPNDGRATIVTYTDSGWQFLRDAHDVKQEIEAAYSAVLGERGLQKLRKSLMTLLES
jgi:DNA-binding MarR family transcriptional regulator